MKIKEGCYYKMRGGGIVYCYNINYKFCEYNIIVDSPEHLYLYDDRYINGWENGSRTDIDFSGDIVIESNHPEDMIEEISLEEIKEKYPEYLI